MKYVASSLSLVHHASVFATAAADRSWIFFENFVRADVITRYPSIYRRPPGGDDDPHRAHRAAFRAACLSMSGATSSRTSHERRWAASTGVAARLHLSRRSSTAATGSSDLMIRVPLRGNKPMPFAWMRIRRPRRSLLNDWLLSLITVFIGGRILATQVPVDETSGAEEQRRCGHIFERRENTSRIRQTALRESPGKVSFQWRTSASERK